jgi:hypothetical protein
MPTLFSLTHPLEEPKPLVHARASLSLNDSGLSSKFSPDVTSSLPPVYVSDHCERVLAYDWRRSILVTFHVTTGRHSLWCVEPDKHKPAVNVAVMAGDLALRQVWTDTAHRLGTVPAANVFVWESHGEGSHTFSVCFQMEAVLHRLQVKLAECSGCECRLPHVAPDSSLREDESSEESDVDLGALSADAVVDKRGSVVTMLPSHTSHSSTVMCIPFGGWTPSPCVTKSRRWLLVLQPTAERWEFMDPSSGCVVPVDPPVALQHGCTFVPVVDVPTDTLRSVPTAILCEASLDGVVHSCHPLLSTSSPLVSQCLLALDAALNPDISLQIRMDVMTVFQGLLDVTESHDGSVTLQSDGKCVTVPTSLCVDTEWLAFTTLWGLYASALVPSPVSVPSPGPSPWQQLLGSAFHNEFSKKYGHVLGSLLPPVSPQLHTTTPGQPTVTVALLVGHTTLQRCWASAITALHWVWNDVALDTTRGSWVLPLGGLLASLLLPRDTGCVSARILAERYHRFGCPSLSWFPTVEPMSPHEVPSLSLGSCVFVLDEVRNIMVGGRFSSALPEGIQPYAVACPRLCGLVAVLDQWLRSDRLPSASIVTVMSAHGFTLSTLSSLPCGVALPLYDVLHAVKAVPPIPWSPSCYALISRHDLVRMFTQKEPSATANPDNCDGLPGKTKVLFGFLIPLFACMCVHSSRVQGFWTRTGLTRSFPHPLPGLAATGACLKSQNCCVHRSLCH